MAVYLLHAYDHCPDDPLICLCLAIASLGRAMQRQADNRNHLITQVCLASVRSACSLADCAAQGMAFLSRYRNIRGAHSRDVDEVEFNFGRAFQQLGKLTSLIRSGVVMIVSGRAALFSCPSLRASFGGRRNEVA